MATFVTDSITDSNGTNITSHTGEVGATWTKHASHAGAGAIDSNRLHSTGADELVYASGTPVGVEYFVNGVFFFVSNLDDDAGLVFRVATGANTFYLVRFTGSGVELMKCVAGVFTSLGTYSSTFAASETHTLDIRCRDASKVVALDGTDRITSSDNAITAAGRAGFRVSANQGSGTGRHLDSINAVDADTALVATCAAATWEGVAPGLAIGSVSLAAGVPNADWSGIAASVAVGGATLISGCAEAIWAAITAAINGMVPASGQGGYARRLWWLRK